MCRMLTYIVVYLYSRWKICRYLVLVKRVYSLWDNSTNKLGFREILLSKYSEKPLKAKKARLIGLIKTIINQTQFEYSNNLLSRGI